MFKIKLLILLLVSVTVLSCSRTIIPKIDNKFSIGYISGEYEGLFLKNLLTNNLSNLGMYDKKSNFRINANISHSSGLFITNIDNTSDRMKIESTLNVEILDTNNDCKAFFFKKNVSQFYIFADSDRYISNNKAERKTREENTESLIKKFINKLIKSQLACNY